MIITTKNGIWILILHFLISFMFHCYFFLFPIFELSSNLHHIFSKWRNKSASIRLVLSVSSYTFFGFAFPECCTSTESNLLRWYTIHCKLLWIIFLASMNHSTEWRELFAWFSIVRCFIRFANEIFIDDFFDDCFDDFLAFVVTVS